MPMAEVTPDGRLNWRSTQDNSDFKKKTLENIALIRLQLQTAGDTQGLKAYDAAVAASSVKEAKARNEVIQKIDKQAEATKKATASAIDGAKTATQQLNELQKLYAKGSSGATYDGKNEAILRVMKASLKDVQTETDKVTSSFLKGGLTLDEYTAKINKLFLSETEYREVLNSLVSGKSKEIEKTKEETQQIERQLGAIERLKESIKQLQKDKTGATAGALPGLNKELATAQAELKRLNTVGLEATSNLTKNIEKPVGAINRLTYAQKLYEKAAKESYNPDIIAKYNAKIEEAKNRLAQLNNAGKKGFDEVGNKIKEATTNSGGFVSTLKNIASTLGIVFTVQTIYNFIGALKDLAVQASGIERAFSRLGDSVALEKLRQQTGGFIADLDLERLTVKANNFNIPLEKLGGFLSFAQERAKATGEDVNKLTDNIIDGLGRKSTRIIDNLGISIVDIQKEFSKTGDFTVAVGNLIAERSDIAGTHVDTLADKVGRLGTKWDNARLAVADYFAKIFNADTPDDEFVGKQTAKLKEQYGLQRENLGQVTDFQKKSSLERQKLIEEEDKRVKSLAFSYKIAKQLQVGDRLPDSKELQTYKPVVSSNSLGRDGIDRIQKGIGEELVTRKNVLATMREQFNQQEKIERVAKNILSLAEMEEQITFKRQQANNIIVGVSGTKQQRQKLLDEANELEKQKNDITGKYKERDKRKDESLEQQRTTAANTLFNAQRSQMQSLEQLKERYNRQSLGRVDSEKQAITDSFDQQRFAIKQLNIDYDNYVSKFGQSAANKKGLKKIDAAILIPLEQNAQEDLKSRQEVQAAKDASKEMQQIYQQYEQFKLEYGEAAAKERFSKETEQYGNYIQFLNGQLNSLQGKTDPKSNLLRDFYTTELPKAQKQSSDYYFDLLFNNMNRALDLTKTRLAEELEINKQYEEDVLTLAFNYKGKEFEKRLEILKNGKNAALLNARETAFEQSKIFTDAATNDVNLTVEELKRKVKLLKEDLKENDNLQDSDPGKLTPGQRKRIKEAIQAAKGVEDASSATGDTLKGISEFASVASNGFGQMASAVQDLNPGLADTFSSLQEISGIASSISTIAMSAMTGNVLGIVSGVFSFITGVISFFGRGKKSAEESGVAMKKYYDNMIIAQTSYNRLLREQIRMVKDITALSLNELKVRKDLLSTQKSQAQVDFNNLLQTIQNNGKQKTGQRTEKYGGIFGIGQKTRVVEEFAGIGGLTYTQLEELFTKGLLDAQTKEWFESLKATKEEMDGIGDSAKDVLDSINQIATGTTAKSISDAIVAGFRAGKRTAADFADDFTKMMQNGLISVFESNYLKSKIDDFYKKYADEANAPGGLTNESIAKLKAEYNKIIEDASKEIANIEKVTGPINDNATSSGNNFQDAIKGITSEEAGLIAGQFGGLRLTQRETNVILLNNQSDFLGFAKSNIAILGEIRDNTGATAKNTADLNILIKAGNDVLSSIDKAVKETSRTSTAGGF